MVTLRVWWYQFWYHLGQIWKMKSFSKKSYFLAQDQAARYDLDKIWLETYNGWRVGNPRFKLQYWHKADNDYVETDKLFPVHRRSKRSI